MRPARTYALAGAPTIAIAAIGCLQPGIDPVFLTLLSAAHGMETDLHGWIVGATQGGIALGALIIWRHRSALPHHLIPLAAAGALLCSLLTVHVGTFPGLLAIRFIFGLAMGLVYTDAMSEAAARRPAAAYGAVFLTQLILSTITAIALPVLSDAEGPRQALLALAAAPLAAAILSFVPAAEREAAAASHIPETAPVPKPSAAAWSLAIATFAFISATMMVWSFTGALAMRSGIDEDMIGLGVALGSIVGALTALTIMRDRPVMPLALTGMLASICLISPLVLTPYGDDWLFVAGILLLNIGSTAIIIRTSAGATTAGSSPLFRRFVACTHPLGMIAGPVAGAILTETAGRTGLQDGAIAALAIGSLSLLFAHHHARKASFAHKEPSVAA